MATIPLDQRSYAAVLIADDYGPDHLADLSWWLIRLDRPQFRMEELLPLPPIQATATTVDTVAAYVADETGHDAVRSARRWLVARSLAASWRHVSNGLPDDAPMPSGTGVRIAVRPLTVLPWAPTILMAETVDDDGLRMVTASCHDICHGQPWHPRLSCIVCGRADGGIVVEHQVDESQTVAEAAVLASWQITQVIESRPYPTAPGKPSWRYGIGPALDGGAAGPMPSSSTTHHSRGAE